MSEDFKRIMAGLNEAVEMASSAKPGDVEDSRDEHSTSTAPQSVGEELPAVLPGHWSTPAGLEMAKDYAARDRAELTMLSLNDFALANAIFMADRTDFDLVVYQTAAKERIRWLSVHLAMAASALQASEAARTLAEAERDELRLAICGGEDAPGYNASLSHETILRVLAENYQTARRDSELAWDGETANSWKARATLAEARVGAMKDAWHEVVAALYKAWPDAEDMATDLPAGIVGRIEDLIAERDGHKLFAAYGTERVLRKAAETQLTASKSRVGELEEALREADLQIVYLHEKFSETGSGNAVLAKICQALSLLSTSQGGEDE